MRRFSTVERGAEFLDEKIPGWEDQIDLDRLDLSQGCRCVVGQLHRGRYSTGLKKLGLSDHAETRRFGFETWTWDASWDNLTEAWKRLILRRRKAAS